MFVGSYATKKDVDHGSILMKMFNLMKYIRDPTTYAIILSVSGAFLVASSFQSIRLVGFIIWVISNCIWTIYFIRTKQTNPAILFLIYLMTSSYGIFSNW
jgi:hypothetical protein